MDVEALLSAPTTSFAREEQTEAENVIGELLQDAAAWPMDARDALAAGEARGPPPPGPFSARLIGVASG